MNDKPYLKYVFGSILLVIIIFIAYNLFAFEPERKSESKDLAITDELVNDLNSYLITDRNNKRYSMYNDFYVSVNNLPYDVTMSLVYNYLNNIESYKIIMLSDEEKNNAFVDNYDAKYKIAISDFQEAYKKVFGTDSEIHMYDFDINDIKGKVINNEYVYIYKKMNIENDNYYVYKMIDSYMISNNGDELTIYEYFVKCSKESGVCYNDDELSMVNNSIKLVNGVLDIQDTKDMVKFKHLYKKENNNYFWYSSEVEEK